MVGKGLSMFLAILAISFGSAAAGDRPCQDMTNCGKCLDKSAYGCVWHIGPDSSGCIESSQCDSDEYAEGECFEGKDGDNKFNTYACGGTCSTESDSTCEDCLSFSPFDKKRRKSDCAWFVKPGAAPQCIYAKKCTDRGFEGGDCIKGKQRGNNSKKCARKPKKDKCEKMNSCNKCLRSRNGMESCALYVEGEETRCISADRCDDSEFEAGVCHEASLVFNFKKKCKAIKNPDDGEGGIKQCSKLDGMCTDCLTNGCFWINAFKGCVDSCDEAPADVGCSGTQPPLETRALLAPDSGDDDVSKMCFDFKLEDKNIKLCKAKNGCDECVSTQLYPDPDLVYIVPPTCNWFPESETCYPFSNGLMGKGTDQCIGIWEPLPGEGFTWPDLLGKSFNYAEDFLSGTYGPSLNIVKVKEDDNYIEDYRLDRVRLFVGKKDNQTIIEVPKIG